MIGSLASAIALAAGLGAQQPRPDTVSAVSFDTTRPPRGVVRDPSGRPIGGADISFRIARETRDSMFWRDSILRTRPLPRVRSSRDGEFFVPLTHVHRLFTPRNSGRIQLVVEKAGYHAWIEPMSAGLRGYLGSNVVLQPIRESDRLTIVVKDPRPGMQIRVLRFGGGLDHDRWLAVPASGTVVTSVSFVPTPLALDSKSNLSVPIGIQVQLVFPGRTTRGKSLRFGQKKIVIGDKVPSTRFVCVLRIAGGQRPESPRGLYRCPDGRSRWFPVDTENVVESSLLPLFAIDARGYLAANIRYLDPEEETVVLAPVPADGPRILELRDGSGEIVKSAQAYFFDMQALPSHVEGKLIGSARARRKLMVEDGRLDLGGRTLPGPGFLYIHAPGFAPFIHFEPRALTGVQRADLGGKTQCGTLELTVTDDESKPLAGVHVILNGSAAILGAHHAGLPRTDANGRVTIDHLRSGSHSIRLIGTGLTESTTTVRMRGRSTVKLAARLFPAPHHRVLLVDEEGRPVPFRAVRSYAQFLNNNQAQFRNQINTTTSVMSDSLGRILFADLPSGVVPRITDQLTTAVRPVNNQLIEGKDIHKIDMVRLDTVLMPLADAPVIRECLLAAGRTSNRTLLSREGAGAMIVRFPRGLGSPTLTVYFQGSPPVRLTEDIVAAARAKQGPGILLVDQRKAVRQVRLALGALGDLGDDAARDLRIEIPGMNFIRNQPYLYGNSGLRVRRAGEFWEVGLRDRYPVAAKVMHPRFLLTDLEIPEGKPGGEKKPGGEPEDKTEDKPINVELRPGTEVVLRLKSTTKLDPSSRFNLYVHTQANRMVLYQREKLAESNLRPAGVNTWELRLPFALEPGKYYFSVRVYNTQLNLSRRLFTVPDRGPFVIEVNKRTARIPSPHATADLEALTTRVQRLKNSAAALRKMGKTDAKSRERLQKVLKDLEGKLETHEKELEKLRAVEKARKLEEQEQEKPVIKPVIKPVRKSDAGLEQR